MRLEQHPWTCQERGLHPLEGRSPFPELQPWVRPVLRSPLLARIAPPPSRPSQAWRWLSWQPRPNTEPRDICYPSPRPYASW